MRRRGVVTTVAVIAAVAAVAGVIGTTVNAAGRTLPASPVYVALGDSVAAGAGLPTEAGGGLCGRSSRAYPSLLAAQLHTSVTNLACSGAKDGDGIINAQSRSGDTIPSQLDRAFQNGVPDLITITIGANDIRWTDLIGKCYTATCGSVADTAYEAAQLTAFQGKLAYTLHKIKDYSGTHTPPKVLITGYYTPLSSTSCLNGKVTSSELRWINAETDNLNKAIKQTVAATTKVSSWFKGTYNFASYVPVSFGGHGLCSNDSWVQGLSDGAPLHPTATGQAQIAKVLASAAR